MVGWVTVTYAPSLPSSAWWLWRSSSVSSCWARRVNTNTHTHHPYPPWMEMGGAHIPPWMEMGGAHILSVMWPHPMKGVRGGETGRIDRRHILGINHFMRLIVTRCAAIELYDGRILQSSFYISFSLKMSCTDHPLLFCHVILYVHWTSKHTISNQNINISVHWRIITYNEVLVSGANWLSCSCSERTLIIFFIHQHWPQPLHVSCIDIFQYSHVQNFIPEPPHHTHYAWKTCNGC